MTSTWANGWYDNYIFKKVCNRQQSLVVTKGFIFSNVAHIFIAISSVTFVEGRILVKKTVVLKTLQFSSFSAIYHIQLESSNTKQRISRSIW